MISETTLRMVLDDAFDAGDRVVRAARLRLSDGFDWSDIESIKVDAMREISAVTGAFIRSQGTITTEVLSTAKSIAVRAWERLVGEWFDIAWEQLWKRLPWLARWVPFAKSAVGAYIRGALLRAGPDLLESAVSGAKAAGRILAS